MLEVHEEFKQFLSLLLKISKNHKRHQSFFNNIVAILSNLENKIKQTFTNYEIFDIFKTNRQIILFLLSKKVIVIEESMINYILTKNSSSQSKYCHFFYPEIKQFISSEDSNLIEEEMKNIDVNVFTDFDAKRKIGENDSYICQLIREDSIDDFIIYINKTDYPLSGQIPPSIF